MKRANPWKITRTAVCLTLAALLACLGRATDAVQPKAKKAAAEPTYTVLNPEAPLSEIDTKPLSPRLSSIAGKTIVIYDDRGGYEKPMQGLADQLKPLLPSDTKFVYYTPTTDAMTDADLEKIPSGDAAIVGHAY
jgi:hypothetical protein